MKVHKTNQELQDTIEGYKMLLEEQKKEIWRLQQIASENEKNINLLQGYKKVIQDLQQFLGSFTEGSDAVKNTVIFVELNGKLHAIRRMEVHENVHPIIGQPGHYSHRLVLKTQKASSLILPEKLQKDY